MVEAPALTVEMICVLGILAFTIYLFVSEIVSVDVAAISIMVLLGLSSMIAPIFGINPLIAKESLFQGFASNAVISIIAVMIIGAGLDKTGIMSRLASVILKIGGRTEARIIPIISGTVGIISSFFQNVGSAALFLPVVSRISKRTGLPLSRLLMPMGFCAILGGTVTMVGSSPLILLNDLIKNSNKVLPEGVAPMQTFELFAVAPIGLALVATGIIYFVLAGRFVLPTVKDTDKTDSSSEYFSRLYGIEGTLFEAVVPKESPLVNSTVYDFERTQRLKIYIVGLRTEDRTGVGPIGDAVIHPGSVLALMGNEEEIRLASVKYRLHLQKQLSVFADLLAPTKAGLSEIVIPPRSGVIGEKLKDLKFRRQYGLKVLTVHRSDGVFHHSPNFRLQQGDTMAVHSLWGNLAAVEAQHHDLLWVITDYPHEEPRPHKVGHALAFFLISLCLVLFTDLTLSVALLTGAIGMIVSGVISIEQAYQSVSWKTVFLLASLIPLGLAVESTGTAAWLAHKVLYYIGDVPSWVLQATIACLATFFTLVMSNIGATVLLVPIAVNIALGAGENPAIFALTVGVATSNSFIIPTHQVNALIMGPAGYRVKDFMRAGGVMTVLFLVVSMVVMRAIF